jgi:hypothetical protein
MTKYLKVKNWEEFQHYKDRTPPWIKLHNSLLDNYEFECLPDASKAHLLCIWMLASRTDNKIPNNADWIKKKIGASTKVDLQLLIDGDFICYHDASKVQQEVESDATDYVPSEEESREDKSREDKPNSPPYEEIKDLYNESFEMLPQCQTLDDSRKASIRKIWRTRLTTVDDWKTYFEYVKNNCKWVMRPKDNGKKNNITWFLRETNLTAVSNGEYDDAN